MNKYEFKAMLMGQPIGESTYPDRFEFLIYLKKYKETIDDMKYNGGMHGLSWYLYQKFLSEKYHLSMEDVDKAIFQSYKFTKRSILREQLFDDVCYKIGGG